MGPFESRKLDKREVINFEKAIKFYLFTRHIKLDSLPEELRERFTHSGNVAFSLLIRFVEDGRFMLEYMEYINDELAALRKANPESLSMLQILPDEIEEIELQQEVPLRFTDAESQKTYYLLYYPGKQVLKYFIDQKD